MKPLLPPLATLLLLFNLQGQERVSLTLKANPIASVKVENGTVWDLSYTKNVSDSKVRYLMYGDSLLSETIEGNRRWYSLKHRNASLIREESLRHSCVPSSPIFTSAFGEGDYPVESEYTMCGKDRHTATLHREGKHISSPLVYGKLAGVWTGKG